MHVQLVTPTDRSRKGNWITAQRWARILRRLGHKVKIQRTFDRHQRCDLLIALHALKSFESIADYRRLQPQRPLIVTLTGTDLYRDIDRHLEVHQALDWADRIVVLQPKALDNLTAEQRNKTRLIRQSAQRTATKVSKSRRTFDVCVVGHLRPVKDPFRAAEASRSLPAASRLRILHAGDALSDAMAKQARQEAADNPRYVWLGNRPPWQVRQMLKSCHVMVLSSRMEGGANVMSEALVAHLPILSSRISGSVGMLGAEHPGLFEVGDTVGLAELMWRCESDTEFLDELEEHSRRLAPLYGLAREVEAWRDVLGELDS